MGGKSVDVNLDNIKVDIASDTNIDATMNSDSDIELKSDSDIKIDTSKIRTEFVLPQPLRMENSFTIPDPIVMQNSSNMGLDIRPMVMDFCFKIEFGRPPPTCISQPYQHHFGITLFGVELLGFNLAGENRIIIQDPPKQPQVAWGSEEHHHASHKPRPAPQVDPGGVRIRVD